MSWIFNKLYSIQLKWRRSQTAPSRTARRRQILMPSGANAYPSFNLNVERGRFAQKKTGNFSEAGTDWFVLPKQDRRRTGVMALTVDARS